MRNDFCYLPSGQYSVPGAGLGLALGLAAAGILGRIYGGFTSWLPIAGFITCVLALAFGAAIGAVTGVALTSGHVRSIGVAMAMGTLAGLAGLYFAWAAWIRGLLESNQQAVSYASVLLDPAALGSAMLRINETGAWSLRGVTFSGGLLWFLWAVEAVLVMFPAVFLPVSMVSEPYCERCRVWCVTNKGVATRRTARGDEPQRLQRKDLGLLQAMGGQEANASDYMRLDLTSCPKCRQMHTLSASNVRMSSDAKGKRSQSVSEVVRHLLLSEQEADAVRRLAMMRDSAA